MSKLPTFAQGLRWTTIATASSFGIGLLQTAILARLLEKTDFAEFAIAAVFINVGIQVQNASINTALIQRTENTSQALSSIFWLNQLFSIALFLLSGAMAIFIGTLYQSTTLVSIFVSYSLLFLINGLGVQQKAILQKYFHFKHLAGIEIIGVCFGFALTTVLAWHGWGALALISGYLGRSAAEAVVVWLLSWRIFLPSFYFSHKEIRIYTRFSIVITLERIVTHVVSQLDILLISKLLGLDSAGIYDLFKRTLLRPSVLLNVALERVILPVFSTIKQDKDALGKAYFGLLNVTLSIHFVIYLSAFIMAQWLTNWYFGADWVEYASVFQALCIFAVFYAFINPLESLLVALNKVHYQIIMYLVLTPVLISTVLWGAQKGLSITVNIIVFVYGFIYVCSFFFILKNLIAYSLWLQIFKPLGFAILSLLMAAVVNYFLPLVSVGIFVFCFLYLTFSWNTEVFRHLQKLLK